MSIDCWNEIPRAAKYSIGDFNQSHFNSKIDHWFKEVFGVSSLVNEIEPFLIAIFKGYLVLSSQIDNYQHHYLLVLVFSILATIDWSQYRDSTKEYSIWQFRILYLQISLVYFWTVVTKLHWDWINGEVLPKMIGPQFKSLANGILGPNSMPIISMATIISEVYLCIFIHKRIFKPFTFLVGVSMHFMMGNSGLQNISTNYLVPKSENYWIQLAVGKGLLMISKQILKMSLPSQAPLLSSVFENGFLLVIVYSVLSSLLFGAKAHPSEKFKQYQVLFLLAILVSVASRSTPHFRTFYTEKGALSIGINNIDSAIDNYSTALEIGKVEWNQFRLIRNQDSDFEFIGDLGLFLESKKLFKEANSIYTEYIEKYPNHLKLYAGKLRCLKEFGDKKQLCLLIPKTNYQNKFVKE
eukprot:gene7577-9315_t